VQDVLELRGVAHRDLEEEDRFMSRQVGVLPHLLLLQEVLAHITGVELVRNDAHVPPVGFGNEFFRQGIEFNLLHTYLRRAPDP
jgi:hypothetical protein